LGPTRRAGDCGLREATADALARELIYSSSPVVAQVPLVAVLL
jgi:hypothetical protein